MSDVKLGTIPDDASGRDAIHIAVAPVTAAEGLAPGEHVGILANGEASSRAKEKVGIVDPYLKNRVHKGGRFFLCLYPYTITSLRHEWVHPAFPLVDESALKLRNALMGSEQYLRDIAAEHKVSYEDLLEGVRNYMSTGEYLGIGVDIEYQKFDADSPFWEHYENVTGIKVEHDKRENFFSCAC